MKMKVYISSLDRKLLESQENLHCVLPISVGQPYHEDLKMEATLDAVNRNFKECTVMVCDTLQRYSHFATSKDKTFEEISKYSLEEGAKWIERNQKYINKLTIPYSINRWNQWLNHPDYQDYKIKIDNLYLNDIEFREVLDDAVYKYVERVISRDENYDIDRVKKMSTMYLKEESAIFFLASNVTRYNYFIYPTIIDLLEILFKKIEVNGWCHPCYLHGMNFKKKGK